MSRGPLPYSCFFAALWTLRCVDISKTTTTVTARAFRLVVFLSEDPSGLQAAPLVAPHARLVCTGAHQEHGGERQVLAHFPGSPP